MGQITAGSRKTSRCRVHHLGSDIPQTLKKKKIYNQTDIPTSTALVSKYIYKLNSEYKYKIFHIIGIMEKKIMK
jgi:hypothetical protein